MPNDSEIQRRYTWVEVCDDGIFRLRSVNRVGTLSPHRITPKIGTPDAFTLPVYPKAAEHTTLEYDVSVWLLGCANSDGFVGWVGDTLAEAFCKGLDTNSPLIVMIEKLCSASSSRLRFCVAQHPRNAEHIKSVIMQTLIVPDIEISRTSNWHRPVDWLGPLADGNFGWTCCIQFIWVHLGSSRAVCCRYSEDCDAFEFETGYASDARSRRLEMKFNISSKFAAWHSPSRAQR